MEPVALFLFLWLYGISLYTDFKYHKIKNIVTFPTAAVGLVLLSIQQGIQTSVSIFAVALVLGFLPEVFRMWGSGDTKLFVSASLTSAILLNTADVRFAFYFLGINTLIYLIAGHGYTLWKSGFRLLLYHSMLKSGVIIGKMPGALPILISNVLAIILNWREPL